MVAKSKESTTTKARVIADVMTGIPLITALNGVKVSFGTHFRWMEADPEYATAIKQARTLFHQRIAEEAESQFLKLVKSGSWAATKYALEKHRREDYADDNAAQADVDKLRRALGIVTEGE